MIRAIAIDDEPPALKIIEKFCAEIEFIQLERTFTKTQDVLRYIKNHPVDLLFLDIQMTSNGIDFYKKLSDKPLVIFTTAYAEYAIEGFNVNAVDYLLKPYTFDRFFQAVNKANAMLLKETRLFDANQYVLVRSNYSLIKIKVEDILFIESFDDYIIIHLIEKKKVVVRMTLKTILYKLPLGKFIRVHRSFILPIEKMGNIRNKTIEIGEKKIPIGNTYVKDFFATFK